MDYHISKKILILDDQPEITSMLEIQIGQTFDCVFVNDPSEALSLLLAEGPFAVIMSDYQMPGMDGVTFLQEANARSPDSIPIMLTSHIDIDIAVAALHEGNIFRFLRKPWERDVIVKSITDAMELYRIKVSERLLKRDLEQANEELSAKVQQLMESNSLLQHWVEFSPAVVYSLEEHDDGYKTSYVSKNFEDLCGYDRTELLSNPKFWLDLIHPDDRSSAIKTIMNALSSDQDPGVYSYRIKHRNGDYITIQDASRIAYNPVNNRKELIGAWTRINTTAN